MSALAPPPLLRESDVAAWADEADVLVVGLGAAGASAAIEARLAGAEVLVLERASGGGGASAIAGGHLYLGGGTPVQTACGFEDSADEMYNYLMALTPDPDPAKIRAYCDDSVAHFAWLEALGVPFERSYFPEKAPIQDTTQCLIWTGNEKVWPYRERAKPAPRGHKVAMAGIEAGSLLMKVLIGAASEAGVRVRCDTRVVALIVDNTGRVVGARYRHFGEHGDVRARRGVVLAAGGYIMNEEMFDTQLAWMPRDLIKHGTGNDDGSGILLGASAGGEPRGLDRAFLTSPFYPPADMLKGILVNALGRRFVAEDSYHGRTAGFLVEQPDGIGYLILDSEIFGYPPYKFFEQALIDGFETIEEMEPRLGLPAGSLVATVAEYNRHASERRGSRLPQVSRLAEAARRAALRGVRPVGGTRQVRRVLAGRVEHLGRFRGAGCRRTADSGAVRGGGLRVEPCAGHAQLLERHLPRRIDLLRPACGPACRRSAKEVVEGEAGEHGQAEPVVVEKGAEAGRGVASADQPELPGGERARCDDPEPVPQTEAAHPADDDQQRQRRQLQHGDGDAIAPAEQDRGRMDAQLEVILAIGHRVHGVEGGRPAERSGEEQARRPRERRRPARRRPSGPTTRMRRRARPGAAGRKRLRNG